MSRIQSGIAYQTTPSGRPEENDRSDTAAVRRDCIARTNAASPLSGFFAVATWADDVNLPIIVHFGLRMWNATDATHVGRATDVGRVLWTWRLAAALFVGLCLAAVTVACGRAEDPARAALRERLRQEASLSVGELDQVRAEVGRTIAERDVLVRDVNGTHEIDPDRRDMVLGMLTQPLGMFDEGLRTEDGSTYRILNGPAESMTMEIEASRRLWIDVETFAPRRFEYAHAFPNPADYSLELVLEE